MNYTAFKNGRFTTAPFSGFRIRVAYRATAVSFPKRSTGRDEGPPAQSQNSHCPEYIRILLFYGVKLCRCEKTLLRIYIYGPCNSAPKKRQRKSSGRRPACAGRRPSAVKRELTGVYSPLVILMLSRYQRKAFELGHWLSALRIVILVSGVTATPLRSTSTLYHLYAPFVSG